MRFFTAFLALLVLYVGSLGTATAALSKTEIMDLYLQGKEFFHQANEQSAINAAESKELYQKAVLRFERIVREGGIHNGKLYYNIGNAYFRMNNIGQAILNYRRAQQFIPNDPNFLQNLQFARDRRRDQISEQQKTRVLKTLFFWHYDLSTRSRAGMFAACFLLAWGCAGLRLFWRSNTVAWGLAVCGLLAAVLLGSLVVEQTSRHRHRAGVIISSEVVARKGDSETYEPSFMDPLHAGTEFRLLEQRGAWCQVELADARTCWMPTNSLALVRPLKSAP